MAIASESDVLTKTLEEHGSSIAIETLAEQVQLGELAGEGVERNVGDADIVLYVAVTANESAE